MNEINKTTKDWEIKNIINVTCDIFAGGDKPKENFSKIKTEEYNIPIYSNGEKKDGLFGFTDSARVFDESITISARGTIGFMKIRKEPFLPIVRLIVVVPNLKIVSIEFLKYFLDTQIIKKTGTSIPQLTVPMVKKMNISFPKSLDEQKRIVEILDEAFENIDQAKNIAEQNLKNIKELFESELQNIFSNNDDNWESVSLENIAINMDSKRIPITKKDRISGKYPYYGASGIVDYVKDYIFEGFYLLVSEDGANLIDRNYPIAFSTSGKFWVNNHAHVLKFKNYETHKFIEYYLNNLNIEPWVTGAAQPKLNQRKLNSIPVNIPKSLDEQQKIVERLDELKEKVDEGAAILHSKIAALDELKKSLLQKAFNGEL